MPNSILTGAWLLSRKNEVENMSQDTWIKHMPRIILVIVLLVSTLVLFISHLFHTPETFFEFLRDFSIAGISAAILGLTIELTLMTALAQRVFEVAFGYVLPEELKAEFRAIEGITIICIKHEQTCYLEPLGDSILMRLDTKRTLKNVGDKSENQKLGLGIDEWFHPTQKSRILSFGYSINGQQTTLIDESQTKGFTRSQWGVSADECIVKLNPREEVNVWWITEEVKRKDDVAHQFFQIPTVEPRATIKVAPQLVEVVACDIPGFSHRNSKDRKIVGEYSAELQGTLLTLQPIEFRWHDKSHLTKEAK